MKRILFILMVLLGVTMQGMAQSSTADAANRIGLVGTWKQVRMYGKIDGELFSHEKNGSCLYIFKNNGTAQYTTNEMRIANAKWTLNGKELHIWGNDTVNDPNGIDYTFVLVMVTPDKLVLKMEGDEDNYAFTEFRKANGSLRPIGTATR